MNIQHHPSDAHLMAHAAGVLPEAFGLVVATHVSLCDECRARLGSFEALGGAVLEDCDAAPMSDDSLSATLALIDAAPGLRFAEKPVPRNHSRTGLPQPLRDYVRGDLDQVRWRPVGMGVRQALLPTQGGARVRLLHIPAGQAVPDHGHKGLEMTLVLRGAFRDQTDRFGPGDVEVAGDGFEHTPVAEAGEDCICLAATEAPLRFNALLPRLAQPFLRI
jgi:putative transcriptional regulator